DEFFGELERAVVVGAVGGDDWQAVGVVVGADEQIAGGLARGVRGIWGVRCGFCKKASRAEAAIDLIGGDMMEAMVQVAGRPKGARGFQNIECANNIRVDEI